MVLDISMLKSLNPTPAENRFMVTMASGKKRKDRMMCAHSKSESLGRFAMVVCSKEVLFPCDGHL
jgi:hypothetical protein